MEYKGHTYWIELDYEEDNIKAFHYVITPAGKKKFADISPYDQSREVIHLWIDAGYPERISCGPLTKEDLRQIIEEKQLAEMFGESE